MRNKLLWFFCLGLVFLSCSSYGRTSWADEGKAFLERNKTKPRVVTLDNGLQYKELIKGNGPKPSRYGSVSVYYTGRLHDGTEFDSSSITKPPVTFKVNRVIKGWTEALTLMPEGSMWEIYIPSELGYGHRGSKGIPKDSVLIFEVELVKVH